MISITKIQETIGLVLLFGVLISLALMLIGGTLYLVEYGSENLQANILQTNTYQTSAIQILKQATSFKAINIIEIGLLTLVFTQIFRVALLTYFYFLMRDFWFSAMSLFILLILLYSLFGYSFID